MPLYFAKEGQALSIFLKFQLRSISRWPLDSGGSLKDLQLAVNEKCNKMETLRYETKCFMF